MPAPCTMLPGPMLHVPQNVGAPCKGALHSTNCPMLYEQHELNNSKFPMLHVPQNVGSLCDGSLLWGLTLENEVPVGAAVEVCLHIILF